MKLSLILFLKHFIISIFLLFYSLQITIILFFIYFFILLYLILITSLMYTQQFLQFHSLCCALKKISRENKNSSLQWQKLSSTRPFFTDVQHEMILLHSVVYFLLFLYHTLVSSSRCCCCCYCSSSKILSPCFFFFCCWSSLHSLQYLSERVSTPQKRYTAWNNRSRR